MRSQKSSRLELDLAHATLACALAATMTKAHVPGDAPEDHEDNTYGLPNGNPLRKKLRAYFRQQLKQAVGFVSHIGAAIPDHFPRMADYTDAMASAMTPILGMYWDKAGKALNGRLGLDPDEWRVTDPNIHRAVAEQSLQFCRATNATTDLGIAQARDQVREALARGLIGEGQTIPQLTARIRQVFTKATKYRAETIARTETSRAVHAASEMSARQSGVVQSKRIMLSANSCPLCVRVAREAGAVALGGSFATIGDNPTYSNVRMPPIHVNCRCSVEYILMDETAPVPAFATGGKPPAETPGEMTGAGGLAEGMRFVVPPGRQSVKPVLALADVAKLDRALAEDADLHVGLGGAGPSAIAGRYDEARRFLERARDEKIAVHASLVSLDKEGRPYIDDGRHRFAALRDSGATEIPVAVGRSQAARFRRLYGPTPTPEA